MHCVFEYGGGGVTDIPQQIQSQVKQAVSAKQLEFESVTAKWEVERGELRREVMAAEKKLLLLEEEHRRELTQLGEQVKTTLKRERDDKRRLHFENAQLQGKLQELSQQLASAF